MRSRRFQSLWSGIGTGVLIGVLGQFVSVETLIGINGLWVGYMMLGMFIDTTVLERYRREHE